MGTVRRWLGGEGGGGGGDVVVWGMFAVNPRCQLVGGSWHRGSSEMVDSWVPFLIIGYIYSLLIVDVESQQFPLSSHIFDTH